MSRLDDGYAHCAKDTGDHYALIRMNVGTLGALESSSPEVHPRFPRKLLGISGGYFLRWQWHHRSFRYHEEGSTENHEDLAVNTYASNSRSDDEYIRALGDGVKELVGY